MNIDSQFTVDLLQQLVRFDTCNPPGNELGLAEHLAQVFHRAGHEAVVDRVAAGRANVIASRKGKGAKGALVFCGHLDTVPANRAGWTRDPHGAAIESGALYGRGSVDMKGGVAAMISAWLALASGPELAGDVVFAGTAGEEVDCIGARRYIEQGPGRVSALVVAEPTRLDPAIAHKGALWLEFTTTGKAAHGSLPSEGYNAVVAMHGLLSRILDRPLPAYVDPLLGVQTLSVGAIHGGSNVNVVPDSCRLTVDIRTLPGQSHRGLLEEFQSMMDAMRRQDARFQVGMLTLTSREAVSTPPEDPFIAAALRTAEALWGRPVAPRGMTYFTDASVLQAALGAPVLIMGPGDERLAHQADEHVAIAEVIRAAEYYAALAAAWLG